MLRKVLTALALVFALSGAALASDLPTTKGPPVYTPPPPFSWTGLYVGGQAGYQWGGADTLLLGPAGQLLAGLPDNPSGFVGGAHLGYNYQINQNGITQIVLGIEGDIEGLTFSGARLLPPPTPPGDPLPIPPFNHLANRIPIQGSLRGRIGYALDRALIYATGGLALADVENSYNSPGDTFWSVRPGWTVGGGLDYALDDHWSLGLEYRYTDFGHYYDALVVTYPGDIARIRLYDNAVRAIFSYKFDSFK